MALIDCPECGKRVSKQASSCPNCGVTIKNKPQEVGCLTSMFIIFGLGIGAIALFSSNTPSTITPSKPAFTVADTSPTAQKSRKDLINDLIQQGIFQKVSMPGSLPRIHVWPAFQALSADDKKLFAGVVLAWYWVDDPKIDMVLFYDARTDKEIGAYSPAIGGLDLD